MTFDARSLAARKQLETKQDERDWLKALENAQQSLQFMAIDDQSLELLALASRSPAKFTVMTRLIYQYGKSHPNHQPISKLMLDPIAESSFSSSDWIDALDYFYNWLTENRRKVDFPMMLNYLQCCAASPEAKEGRPTLFALVEDMLRIHGYNG